MFGPLKMGSQPTMDRNHKPDIDKAKSPSTQAIDPDFALLESKSAVSIYKNKNAEFVIAVDLSQGGRVDFLNGTITGTEKKSVYGGPNPAFTRISASEAYRQAKFKQAGISCVVNSGFFSTAKEDSSPLAFSSKQNHKIISDGFADKNKHKDMRLTLALADKYARIISFRNEDYASFKQIPEKNATVSLSPKQNIDGKSQTEVGRTFLGLSNSIGQDKFTRVLIFVSRASTQAHALATLKGFGAGPAMMFDGGGSSQLYCNQKFLVPSTRRVPQYLTISSSPKKRP